MLRASDVGRRALIRIKAGEIAVGATNEGLMNVERLVRSNEDEALEEMIILMNRGRSNSKTGLPGGISNDDQGDTSPESEYHFIDFIAYMASKKPNNKHETMH